VNVLFYFSFPDRLYFLGRIRLVSEIFCPRLNLVATIVTVMMVYNYNTVSSWCENLKELYIDSCGVHSADKKVNIQKQT